MKTQNGPQYSASRKVWEFFLIHLVLAVYKKNFPHLFYIELGRHLNFYGSYASRRISFFIRDEQIGTKPGPFRSAFDI